MFNTCVTLAPGVQVQPGGAQQVSRGDGGGRAGGAAPQTVPLHILSGAIRATVSDDPLYLHIPNNDLKLFNSLNITINL